jgi:pyridoxal phosphate enzyme (YggS family)
MTEAELRSNLSAVRERIGAAAARAGRRPEEIQLMAVTKTFPVEYVQLAHRAGVTLFGENRVQEAATKYGPLLGTPPEGPPLRLHLIGHLQRNKARAAAELFACVQSIDKLQTAEALDRHCVERGRRMEVLLELNTSGEQTKFGVGSETEMAELLEGVAALPALRPCGLMTVGPLTGEEGRIRRAFARLRALLDALRSRFPELPLHTLSMGMSGDFETAIEEGATMVRLGTALFGTRGA